MRRRLTCLLSSVLAIPIVSAALMAAQEPPPFVIELADYAAVPMTGSWGAGGNLSVVARINFMRQEPVADGRFFVNDLNGPLYLLDRETKQPTLYLNLNGRDGAPGVFERLGFPTGLGQGFVSFQFDPDYGRNGRFYTVHVEELAAGGSPQPRNTGAPGLDLTGYTTTAPVPVVGDALREGVVVEWTDTNITNTTFEGTAREILRIQLNLQLHPTGDMIFNPTATPGDADWRVMYLTVGDGGAGEQKDERRSAPQRLDMMVGKVLRIIPDLALRTASSTISANGRYRIPDDNPFVAVDGALTEIWALGLRNPHRLIWDVDPANPADNRLIVMSVGLRSWESVYIVRKGANFGYSEREGNQYLDPATNLVAPLPGTDTLPIRVGPNGTRGSMAPTYPVLQYNRPGGFAIAGGVVYRGTRLPALRGKFLFGDLLSGRLWVADLADMMAADDGRAETVAPFREVRVRWRNPSLPAGSPLEVIETMRPMTVAGYEARRDADPAGRGAKAPGRVDIRFATGADGEIYITTKADGMIRTVVAAEPSAR